MFRNTIGQAGNASNNGGSYEKGSKKPVSSLGAGEIRK
jgi:hypothetical protein